MTTSFSPPMSRAQPPLGAALIGAGFIGPVHLEALSRIGVPVVGVLGSTPEKSSAAARRLSVPRGYASLNELLDDPTVTTVHIASPNRLHYQQASACLAAGKHLICEKPLGMTSRETAALAKAAVKHPHQICAVNYNIRFYPMVLQARAMVHSGELGNIFHLNGSYAQDWLLWESDYNWRVSAEEGGELRAVGDIGTHWLDLLLFITGLEVEAVLADLRTVHPYRTLPASGSSQTFTADKGRAAAKGKRIAVVNEDEGSILLRFKGGARGNVHVSQVTAGRKNSLRFEIAGSLRAVAWDSEGPDTLWVGARSEANRVVIRDPALLAPEAAHHAQYPGGHCEGFPDTFKQLYRAVYADIAAGTRSARPLYATFADGHQELVLCDAIARSQRQQRWVNL